MILNLYGLGAELKLTLTGEALEATAAGLQELWARCLVPSETTARAEPITHECTGAPASELVLLTQYITRNLIASQAGRLLMFHAGAVCNPETGASVAYVAEGGTGKTTLSEVLGQTHGYITDETVAVDESGRIWGYPKPLSIRQGSTKVEHSPASLGLVTAPANPRLARLTLLARDGGLGTEELNPIDAICALVPQTSSLSDVPKGLHRLMALLEMIGPALRHHYGEATDVAPELVSGL